MYENIDKAIELLAAKITNGTREDQALKYTQSVSNLAHAKATLMAINKPRAAEATKTPEPQGGRA